MARENWHLWAVALGVELSAWSAAHLGDDEVAAQRWGLSRAAFESAGFDTTPLHRTLWRPIEAGLRDRLGDRFEAAVRVGRTLDLASFAPTATAAQQGHE